MKVIASERIPIKMWLDDIEDGALAQAKNLANLPFIFKHIAIMPDCHQGYGMPIGGVMATQGVVVPNAVGVDIGCGMCAVKTPWNKLTDIKYILGSIREAIPVGFKKHETERNEAHMPHGHGGFDMPIVSRHYQNARKSLGTLGGGNHFIEIQKGDDGFIWVMIHSGSRNLGKQVADHYNKVAVDMNEKYHSSVTKDLQLAFLPFDSKEGRLYLQEMQYCVDFALANRKMMMAIVCDILNCDSDNMINIAHNYAVMENHFNTNVMIHRKGATLAREGTIGIIPGSQGTSSYIVEGKGNPMSFNSCSHGAGRTMGRKQAQRELSLDDEVKRLDDMGVLHSIRGVKDLDEAAGAYKDIDTVMANQADLIEIKVKLTPIAVIKG
jgi:tRNA-splicing ligase RtcB